MYAKNIDCPDCESSLSVSARKCKCGWEKNNSKKIFENFCSCGKVVQIKNLCEECYEPFRPVGEFEKTTFDFSKILEKKKILRSNFSTLSDFLKESRRLWEEFKNENKAPQRYLIDHPLG